MHSPPRTPSEIAALLARGVERLEALGVAHDRAVEAVASDHGVDPERLAHLLDVNSPDICEKTAVLA